jgi:cytochrome c peroxidase
MGRIAVASSVCMMMCGCVDGGRDGFTGAEWDVVATLSPLPDVEYDAAAAPLGQKLFFERRFGGEITVPDHDLGDVGASGKIACADCHVPATWFMDTRSNPNDTSLGAQGRTGRNAPSLVNAIYHRSFPWHGRYATIAELMQAPLKGPTLMASTEAQIAGVLADHYQAEYDALFPETPIGSFDDTPETRAQLLTNVGYALEAYQRRLISRNAPFDRYVAGDDGAISQRARRGLALFIGDALCVECHNGPALSDDRFHRTGVASDDIGRANVEGHESLVGYFRTPGLRQSAETAPYLHDGSLASLGGVMDFYWRGGDTGNPSHPAVAPLNDLTADDLDDLVAFLATLTGEPIPDELTENTSNP